jgi:tetratricopeptide (TPR) repeat protein
LATTTEDKVPQQPLPEDEGPNKAEQMVAGVLKKWYVIVVPIVIIVLVFVILGVAESHSKSVSNEASQAVVKAESVDDFLKIHEKYPDTTSGMVALKQAADDLYGDEEFSRSRELYLKFIDAYPQHPLNAWIQNQIGFTYEAEGEYDKALEAYDDVFDYENYIFLEKQVEFNRGRCYEMKGEIETAKSYFNNLVSEDGAASTGWSSEAQYRLQMIELNASKSGPVAD